MSVQLFLADLNTAGIRVSADGEKLSIKSSVSPIPSEWVEKLKARKLEVLHFLQQRGDLSSLDASISIAPEQSRVAATSNQKRLWLVENHDVKGAYNIAVGYRFCGDLNVSVFNRCIYILLSKHDVFRMQIVEQNDDLWLVEQSGKSSVELEQGAFSNAEITTKLEEYAATCFSVVQAGHIFEPLYKHGLFTLKQEQPVESQSNSGGEWVYLFACHHLIMDGHSLGLFFSQLTDMYNQALADGNAFAQEADTQPELGFRDYAYWLQNGGGESQIKQDLSYWLEQYQGAEHRLVFPPMQKQSLIQNQDGALSHCLGLKLSDKIHAFAKQYSVTPFSILYACFKLFLAQMSGQRDFLIGHPVASRQLGVQRQLANVFGYFANTIALRVKIDESDSFIELVSKVQQANVAGLSHQHAPFESIIEGINPPVFWVKLPLYKVFLLINKSWTWKAGAALIVSQCTGYPSRLNSL